MARGFFVSLALRDCLPLSSSLAACTLISRYCVRARHQTSRLLPTPLAYRELHEWCGKTVRCAAAFCIARFLARCIFSDLSLLRSDYAFAQGMYLHLTQGRVSRQVCAVPRQRRFVVSKVFASRRLPPPLAHRELYERRGETVRCAAAFL